MKELTRHENKVLDGAFKNAMDTMVSVGTSTYTWNLAYCQGLAYGIGTRFFEAGDYEIEHAINDAFDALFELSQKRGNR